MLKELRYRFRHHNCWLQETTERHRGVTLVVSSVYTSDDEIHVDLTVHGPDRDTIAAVEAEWRRDARISKVARLYDGPRGVRFHVGYRQPDSIYPQIVRHSPVALGSIRIAQGVEHYSIVGEPEDVQRLVGVLAEKGDVRVDSVRTLDEMPYARDPEVTGTLAETLTDKQLEALLVAYAEGYYRWPRTVSASQLAASLERSSSAFLSHLRQAESKVLEDTVRRIVAEDPGRLEAAQARLKPRPPPT